MENKISPIQDVIEIIEYAERLGNSIDEPEGTRYIQISETLANTMVNILKSYIVGIHTAGSGRERE